MVIAAHLEESDGKPREPRRKLRLETQGALPSGVETNVLVHNVSATGLLLQSEIPLETGDTLEIELPENGATAAKVIWTSGPLFGCEFETPISAATLSAAQLRGAVIRELDVAPRQAMSAESFGVRLQRLRKAQNLTLSQLAAELHVSKPTVWAWEHGKAKPVESRISALAQALDVPTSELQPGRDAPLLGDLIARSREQIARALGTSPEKVRIMIDL